MTNVKIRTGIARRLGLKMPTSPLLGVLVPPAAVLTPEEYDEVKSLFTESERASHQWIYPSEEDLSPSVRRGWFRRDSA